MGGLTNEASQNKVFLNIYEGQFAKRVDPSTEGATKRKLKTDKIVHELYYNALEGYLLAVEEHVHEEYGKFFKLTLENDGVLYCFDMKQTSGYAMGFLYRIESCDLTEPIKFKPYYIEDKEVDGKFKAYMVLYQNGKKIESNYTKDNPNGLPEMKQVEVNGDKVWDSSDRMSFLKSMLQTNIIMDLPGVPDSAPVEIPAGGEGTHQEGVA